MLDKRISVGPRPWISQIQGCRLIVGLIDLHSPFLLGDHSEMEPPDPIPNSEVKRFSADGSVGFPHVRVGHRQAPHLVLKNL